MSSHVSKVKQMKKNVEIATARAIKADEQTFRRELTQKEKDNYRKDFEQRARKLDKEKLHEVWND